MVIDIATIGSRSQRDMDKTFLLNFLLFSG